MLDGAVARMRQFGVVDHDRGGRRDASRRQRPSGSDFSGSSSPVRADRSRTCSDRPVARGDEDLPIAVAAHAHRVPPPSQKLKSPTTLTRRAFGAHTTKATPSTPSMTQRMRAKLVVETQMLAFAEEMEVEVGQNGREAIGVVDLARHCRRIARATGNAVEPFGIVPANRPASWMRASFAVSPCSPMASTLDASGRKTRTTVPVSLGMRGRDSGRDRSGGLRQSHRPRRTVYSSGLFCRLGQDTQQTGHRHAQPVWTDARAHIRSHSTAFSSKKKSTMASLAWGSSGHSRAPVMVSR